MDIGACGRCHYWLVIKCRCVCFRNYSRRYYFYTKRTNGSCIFYWYDISSNDTTHHLTAGNSVSIPALGNTFLSLIKDTSLLGFILVAEMFRKAQEVASTTYEYLTIYVLVALMYWVVCFIISIIQGIYESYIERGYRS